MNSVANMRPEYLITLVHQEDGKWLAMGSRKIDYLEISAVVDDYGATLYSDFNHSYIPSVRGYDLTTRLQTHTYCSGTSPLAALGALWDELTRQEKEEEKQNAEIRAQIEIEQKRREKELKKKSKKSKKTNYDDNNYVCREGCCS